MVGIRNRVEKLEAWLQGLPPAPPRPTPEESRERLAELLQWIGNVCRQEGIHHPNFCGMNDEDLSALAGPRDQELRVCGTTPARFAIALLARIILRAKQLKAADAKRRRKH